MTAVARLCELDALADPGAIELGWGEGAWPLPLFVVRRGGELHGYLNRCPHAGHELNLAPNEFLTRDGALILCRSHGARFRIDDGICVAGPCPGAALRRFAVEVVDGFVVANEGDLRRLASDYYGAGYTRR